MPFLARLGLFILTFGTKTQIPKDTDTQTHKSLSQKITKLGAVYVKLCQSLATRPDIIGKELAYHLSFLQDKIAPFPQNIAQEIVAKELGEKSKNIKNLSPPIMAASIAQVHSATHITGKKIAVKILRPSIEAQLKKEIGFLLCFAKCAHFLFPKLRRLCPVGVIQVLANSIQLETDLRIEAASLSKMKETTKKDEGFLLPDVFWDATTKHILTMSFMEGTNPHNIKTLDAYGINRKKVATSFIQHFLRHALRDGFFHADLHQGNLLLTKEGSIVALDFGIMGHLGQDEREFLAGILYGFITRNYEELADIHFQAGYVPKDQNKQTFALALRAIGEPIYGQGAQNISMGELLAQLFDVTAQFNMRTQPQLLLLQKTMVVTEGVARSLDPTLNIWVAARPVVEEFMRQKFSPETLLKDTKKLAHQLSRLPHMIDKTIELQDQFKDHINKQNKHMAKSKRKQTYYFWFLGVLGLLVFLGLLAVGLSITHI